MLPYCGPTYRFQSDRPLIPLYESTIRSKRRGSCPTLLFVAASFSRWFRTEHFYCCEDQLGHGPEIIKGRYLNAVHDLIARSTQGCKFFRFACGDIQFCDAPRVHRHGGLADTLSYGAFELNPCAEERTHDFVALIQSLQVWLGGIAGRQA